MFFILFNGLSSGLLNLLVILHSFDYNLYTPNVPLNRQFLRGIFGYIEFFLIVCLVLEPLNICTR